jgi:hypothetical protein
MLKEKEGVVNVNATGDDDVGERCAKGETTSVIVAGRDFNFDFKHLNLNLD